MHVHARPTPKAGSLAGRSGQISEKFRESVKTLAERDDVPIYQFHHIDRVFRQWWQRIPLPLRPQDREAGYDWDLSIWQMEVSLTQGLRPSLAWA